MAEAARDPAEQPRVTEAARLPRPGPSFAEAFRFWVKLGFINFGGPAGQIAIMHREIVDERRWVSEEQFLRALNFCTILPGPEAQQLATYIGWRLHGVRGGIVAGAFFVIPSIFVLAFLSYLAVAQSDVPAIAGLLYGIQPVVIAIVIEAVIRIGKRALHHPVLIAFGALAFVALYFFRVPFPVVIVAAALAGVALQSPLPDVFRPRGGHGGGGGKHGDDHAAPVVDPPERARPSIGRTLRIAAICFVLWIIPIGALWLWRGTGDVLVQEALFFTWAAFITFGGAYAVLSYITRVAVTDYGWLSADQMVQGLALAESTPGPLIMVTEYVGFLGAYQHPGDLAPIVAGLLGALVTVYVTFLPCFLFIFAGAPYIEALSGNRRLQAALVGVTAAVVGVILNLAVFFATRVLFANGRLDVFALLLAVVSYLVVWRFKTPTYFLVPAGAIVGMVWTLLRPAIGG
jgi:chromate transporter